jgi:signal transduction histidine kinase
VKLVPGLGWRIVAAAVLCGVVGFASARAVSGTVTREAVLRFHEPLARYTYVTYERARCEAAPAEWSIAAEHGARTYAYDAETLASRNPSAPPLDRSLWERVSRPGSPPLAIEPRVRTLASGGVLVFHVGDGGPCAILQTTWPAQPVAADVLLRVWIAALFAAAFAAGLGFFAVVRPLARRIHQAAAELEQRRLDLQRHLADVAHDLKTPISSLHIALEQAIDESRDAEVRGLLAGALHDAVYLGALTSNLRLASELREGYDPGAPGEAVALNDVVEHVVARARFFARRRGVAIDAGVPDEPAIARCAQVAAEQALSNVVDNAITHGEPGGHVAVLLEASGGRFRITIADDGPGVPPSELPRLGERTFRSDEARQRDPRGSGLGLAITSEVCARCGWTLAFEREEPRGLRVVITGRTAQPDDRAPPA